jgi:hypothetical protein
MDLEVIERVMVEKQQEKLKVKGKAATAWPEKGVWGPNWLSPYKGLQ